MADNNSKSEKSLIRDIVRLLSKHGVEDGKTTIKVAPATAVAAKKATTTCTPPQVPTQITITMPDGTKVATTICK